MHIYCLNQYDLQIELSKFILGKILDWTNWANNLPTYYN